MKQPVVLRIYINEKLEGVRQFTEEQVVIGRNDGLHVQLNEEGVSPLHAVIEERGDSYHISDLGSQLGTQVNGKAILDEKLNSGDEIRIGPYKVEFFIGIPKPVSAPPSLQKMEEKKTDSTVVKMPSLPTDAGTPAIPNIGTQPPPIDNKVDEPPLPIESDVDESGGWQVTETPKIPESTIVEQDGSGLLPPIRASHKTFAPETARPAGEILKPGKGTSIEVIVAWKERIIASRHFNEKGVVTIGASEGCDISIPIIPGVNSYPIVEIDSLASINVPPNTPGEIITADSRTTFGELHSQNKFMPSEAGAKLQISQGEMARIGFQGDLMNVYVRYAPESQKPLIAPLLDLTASEVTGVILAAVVSLIFGVYMFLYAPSKLNDENRLEEPIRKATVTFRPPKKRIVKIEQVEKPPEKKVVKIVKKEKQTKTPSAPKAGKPGKAGDVVKKKNSQNKPKKLTSARSGGSKKTGKKKGANMKTKKPDPTKVGLLSVFGSKGAQKKLDKTFSGSGELQGMADVATGYSGDNENRVGDTFGSKIKDTGAGGRGENTVGISGLGTKGRGTGDYGTGTGGIGKKGSVDINVGGQGAQFVGSMDREAIRRVILNNKRAIRSCYERELQRRPNMYGKLVLQWNIEEKGRVSATKVKTNTLGSNKVANCILSRLRTWRFPEPPPGVVGQVSYPFVFTSQ